MPKKYIDLHIHPISSLTGHPQHSWPRQRSVLPPLHTKRYWFIPSEFYELNQYIKTNINQNKYLGKLIVFNLYLLGAHTTQCLMQYDADLLCFSVVSPTQDGAVCSCLTSCSAAGRSVLVKRKPEKLHNPQLNQFLGQCPNRLVSADKTANTDTKPGSPLYTMPQMWNKVLPSSLSLSAEFGQTCKTPTSDMRCVIIIGRWPHRHRLHPKTTKQNKELASK
jgi:hypothetical protein